MRYDSVWLKALLIISLNLTGAVASAAEFGQRRTLDLELEEVPGSSGYEVEVVRLLPNGRTGKAEKFRLKTTSWHATLAPGHYTMRVRSLDSRDVPGEWNESRNFMVKLFAPHRLAPEESAVVKSDNDEKEKIKFQWDQGEKAESYKIEIKDTKGNVVVQNDLTDTSIYETLLVGQDYSWQVTPANKSLETEGESSPPYKFKLVGKKLDAPKIMGVTEIETKLLSWKPSTHAEKYEVELDIKTNDSFKSVRTWSIPQFAINLNKALASGTYRLKVKATAYDRRDSEESVKEFETVNTLGDDLPRASYQLRKIFFVSLGVGPGFFNYQNNNLDLDTNSSVSAYGLSLNLTFGTWFSPHSRWGLMGSIKDQSIPLSGSASNYGAASLVAVRKFNAGQSSQFRVYGGFVNNEIPEVASDIYGNIQQQKISTFGPVLRAEFYHGLTPQLGYNLMGEVSAPLTGNSPTGSSITSQVSKRLGFGVSKRMRENLLGKLDYFYDIENAGYYHPSDFGFPNIPNGTNQVTLSSHNIMFTVEFGF